MGCPVDANTRTLHAHQHTSSHAQVVGSVLRRTARIAYRPKRYRAPRLLGIPQSRIPPTVPQRAGITRIAASQECRSVTPSGRTAKER
jgi:hypothetical protein